jgi:hypothetical protein
MEPAARLQVEAPRHQGEDGAQAAGAQRFLDRPERRLVVLRLEHDEAFGIDAEPVQPMPIRNADPLEKAGGGHEQGRALDPAVREARHRKPEGGRYVLSSRGGDLMKGAEGEASLREMAIDLGHPEREAPFVGRSFENRQNRPKALNARGSIEGPIQALSRYQHARPLRWRAHDKNKTGTISTSLAPGRGNTVNPARFPRAYPVDGCGQAGARAAEGPERPASRGDVPDAS